MMDLECCSVAPLDFAPTRTAKSCQPQYARWLNVRVPSSNTGRVRNGLAGRGKKNKIIINNGDRHLIRRWSDLLTRGVCKGAGGKREQIANFGAISRAVVGNCLWGRSSELKNDIILQKGFLA